VEGLIHFYLFFRKFNITAKVRYSGIELTLNPLNRQFRGSNAVKNDLKTSNLW